MTALRVGDMAPRRRLLVCAAAAVLAASFAWGGLRVREALQIKIYAAEPLSAYVPQGSLMAVETPDFAGLLAHWTNSAEEKAWIKSDTYADFSRSRLFSRLGEAQSEFAASAGLAPDAGFLRLVAGKESVFAWYDIGKLEFLYVTRMKPGEAAKNPLMNLADRFQMRKAGADSFYIRTEEVGEVGAGDQISEQSVTGSARTVAFAVHGDLLLLATREDLIANALLLAQHQGDATLRNEPWYLATTGSSRANSLSGDAATPDLRMTLNLAKIVPSPYFRTYWVQKNVSDMKQYSAAVSDLYRTKEAFREDRVLIPKTSNAGGVLGDLGPILRYLPADSGVYRATVKPDTAAIIDQVDRRLLSRGVAAYRDVNLAPVADLSDLRAGSSWDLDTPIDEQPVQVASMASATAPLRRLIDGARPEAMLVYSSGRGDTPSRESDAVFLPMRTAVVLAAAVPWDTGSVQGSLTDVLQTRLTVGGAGLNWKARQQDGEDWVELGGLQPLTVAVRGQMLLMASDPETLLQLLRSAKADAPTRMHYADVSTVAGFNHSAERERFKRLAALLDRKPSGIVGANPGTSPAFFSGSMESLSETFLNLDSETFVEGSTGNGVVRQTVIYRWKP